MKGKELHTDAAELKRNYLTTGKPKYWPTDPNKIPDLLDFIISKNVSEHYIDVKENLTWPQPFFHNPNDGQKYNQ